MDLGHVGGSSANTTTITTVGPVGGITTTTTTNLAYQFNTKFTDNIVRVGLNYKFGGGAVVARY
jgi:outer membrane immunogenic protein